MTSAQLLNNSARRLKRRAVIEMSGGDRRSGRWAHAMCWVVLVTGKPWPASVGRVPMSYDVCMYRCVVVSMRPCLSVCVSVVPRWWR